MAVITSTQKSHLNKMNRASKDVLLGDRINTMGYAGSAVVTLSQMSASAVTVYNALATGGVAIYSVARSGSPLYAPRDFKHTRSGGSLTISPFNSGSLNVGDVISYLIA